MRKVFLGKDLMEVTAWFSRGCWYYFLKVPDLALKIGYPGYPYVPLIVPCVEPHIFSSFLQPKTAMMDDSPHRLRGSGQSGLLQEQHGDRKKWARNRDTEAVDSVDSVAICRNFLCATFVATLWRKLYPDSCEQLDALTTILEVGIPHEQGRWLL